MKSLGLISQVLTVGLSVAIALLYIKPTYEEVAQIQTDISDYREQTAKIEKVNEELQRHVAAQASVSPTDAQKLATYMPRFVDEIAVMRDLQFIANESGIIFKAVGYNGETNDALADAAGETNTLDPTGYEFSLVAEGTYSQVKGLLSLLEQNEYPLEVHQMAVSPLEGGFLTVDLILVTYADNLLLIDE